MIIDIIKLYKNLINLFVSVYHKSFYKLANCLKALYDSSAHTSHDQLHRFV